MSKQIRLQGMRPEDLHRQSWIDRKSAAVEQVTDDLALQGLHFLSRHHLPTPADSTYKAGKGDTLKDTPHRDTEFRSLAENARRLAWSTQAYPAEAVKHLQGCPSGSTPGRLGDVAAAAPSALPKDTLCIYSSCWNEEQTYVPLQNTAE